MSEGFQLPTILRRDPGSTDSKFAEDQADDEKDTTMFGTLCDIVVSSIVDVDVSMVEFGYWKDEMLNQMLPANVLLRLLVSYAKMHRAAMDLQTPLLELVRLVRLYAPKWHHKSMALTSLHTEYEKNKRHLDVALKRASISVTEVERSRKEKLLYNWELLFAKLLSRRRHGRRWRFLIDSFTDMMRQEKPILIESDSNDEDDDTGVDPERRLPLKRTSIARGSVMLRRASKRKDVEAELALMQERDRLAAENKQLKEQLDEMLILKPRAHRGIQTEAKWVEPVQPLPLPFRVDLNDAFRDQAPEPRPPRVKVVLRAKYIKGLTEAAPADIVVNVDLTDSVGMFKERSTSTAPALVVKNHHAHTIDQNLVLTLLEQQDKISVQLRSGVNGEVMAYGLFPASIIVDSITAQVKNRVSDAVTTVMSLETCVIIKLTLTKEYISFRNNSIKASKHRAALDQVPSCSIEFAVAVIESNNTESAKDLQSSTAVPEVMSDVDTAHHDPSKRRNRLRQALEEGTIQEESESLATELFDTLDAKDADLDQATFTMQEMMELAMLHARQMQMLHQHHEEELAELEDSLRKPDVIVNSIAAQTDPMESTIVEVPVEKIVKEVVIQRVEVPVYIEVEKKVTSPPPKLQELMEEEPEPISAPKQHVRHFRRVARTLPDSFFDRLVMFTEQSLRRMNALRQRRKEEVEAIIEQQLKSRYLLADPTKKLSTEDDVCLPALFMPSPGVVYNPRATHYWHPTGSKDIRLSQPPSIVSIAEFKLPPVVGASSAPPEIVPPALPRLKTPSAPVLPPVEVISDSRPQTGAVSSAAVRTALQRAQAPIATSTDPVDSLTISRKPLIDRPQDK